MFTNNNSENYLTDNKKDQSCWRI